MAAGNKRKLLTPHIVSFVAGIIAALVAGGLLSAWQGPTVSLSISSSPSSSESVVAALKNQSQQQIAALRQALSSTKNQLQECVARKPLAHSVNKNNNSSSQDNVLHILYGASGNATGFLEEIETSLKSVLLNAPLEVALHVHFLVDTAAQDAIEKLLQPRIDTQNWRTRQEVQIHSYKVDKHLPAWTQKILQTFAKYPDQHSRFRHSVGAYFRLFAQDVLPPTVRHVLYMDSDVVILSGLDVLWQAIREQDLRNYLFQWGAEQCSGFSTIAVTQLPTVWQAIAQAPAIRDGPRPGEKIRKLDDQFLMRAVQVQLPARVGLLPPEWDVSAANGPWRSRHNGQFLATHFRPNGAGMLHLNGGRGSLANSFEHHRFTWRNRTDLSGTWGLVHYYGDVPWNWARYMVASKIPPGQQGYPLVISHRK